MFGLKAARVDGLERIIQHLVRLMELGLRGIDQMEVHRGDDGLKCGHVADVDFLLHDRSDEQHLRVGVVDQFLDVRTCEVRQHAYRHGIV